MKALYVHMQNLPNYPPGAKVFKLSLLTLATSTPGIFLKALINLTFSFE